MNLQNNLIPSILEEAEQYEEFFAQVQQFKRNNIISELTFDSSLSPFQRKIIHHICDKLNLSHESRGEGKDRYLVVSRKPKRGASFPRKLDYHQSPRLELAFLFFCCVFFFNLFLFTKKRNS